MSLTPLNSAAASAAAPTSPAAPSAASAAAVDENTHLLRTERRLFRSLRGGTSSGKSLDGTEQVSK